MESKTEFKQVNLSWSKSDKRTKEGLPKFVTKHNDKWIETGFCRPKTDANGKTTYGMYVKYNGTFLQHKISNKMRFTDVEEPLVKIMLKDNANVVLQDEVFDLEKHIQN